MSVWNLVTNNLMKTSGSMLIAIENLVHFLRSANYYGATPPIHTMMPMCSVSAGEGRSWEDFPNSVLIRADCQEKGY